MKLRTPVPMPFFLAACGGGSNGAADAKVIFESAEPAPVLGGWDGIVLHARAMPATRITHAMIRHGGGRTLSAHEGGVTLNDTEGRVSISETAFEANDRADLYIACDSRPTLSANTFASGGPTLQDGC